MLPLFLKKNTKSFDQSFYTGKHVVPHTYDIWHNHIELEFLHILKGSGTRFIGDSIEAFESGDLVLVGPNLPHFWRSDKVYYENNTQYQIELILTQFDRDFMGREFLHLPEMKSLSDFLDDAAQGVQIIGETRDKVSRRLIALAGLSRAERLLEFVSILNTIALTKEYRKLSSVGFTDSYQSKGADRINKIHDFIMNNFTQEITLKEAAEIAHMNEAAFCRFFKSSTLKTFTQFLNEVRIGYACRLLLQENMNIASVGYESGFQNISYFNKVFKNALGLTPQQYQKQHNQA